MNQLDMYHPYPPFLVSVSLEPSFMGNNVHVERNKVKGSIRVERKKTVSKRLRGMTCPNKNHDERECYPSFP
jgi:hypothetical protein